MIKEFVALPHLLPAPSLAEYRRREDEHGKTVSQNAGSPAFAR
jgi:hypothetical protein